jgi:hypothetical protein
MSSNTNNTNNRPQWLQVVLRATANVSRTSDGDQQFKTVGWRMNVWAPYHVRVIVLCPVPRENWEETKTNVLNGCRFVMPIYKDFFDNTEWDETTTNPARLVALRTIRDGITALVDRYGVDVLPPDVREAGNHVRQLCFNIDQEVGYPELPGLLPDMYPVERVGNNHNEQESDNGRLTAPQLQRVLRALSWVDVGGIRINRELVDQVRTRYPQFYEYRSYKRGGW